MSANNTVILIGRLTRDVEISYARNENSTAIAKFSLAVDRGDKNKTTDFINCTCFASKAEFCEKYIQKGTKVVVKGLWATGNYTNKDGNKVYTNDCLVEDISFAESKNASQQSNDAPPTQAQPKQSAGDGFMNLPEGIDEDDLPFARTPR